ncbi:MAG: peptide ABC transporter permease [Candidatus Binatia bacterium]|nr:MAG: peptide ABC transporter permease [Candidatus Binatia bacterium]
MLLPLGIVAVAAPVLPLPDPIQPVAPSFGDPWPPQWHFPCGTDELGRDVCSRVIYGARLSLFIAVAASFGSVGLGTLIGLLAGYAGGLLEQVFMRATDVVLSFPVLLLAMGVAALFEPNVPMLLFVIVAVGWTTSARTVRAEVKSIAAATHVVAAQALGAGPARILLLHVVPALSSTVFTLWAMTASHALLIDAGLSFIGLGTPPPAPSWGRMLSESQTYYRVAPWLMLFPGACLTYAVGAFQLIALGLSRPTK